MERGVGYVEVTDLSSACGNLLRICEFVASLTHLHVREIAINASFVCRRRIVGAVGSDYYATYKADRLDIPDLKEIAQNTCLRNGPIFASLSRMTGA